VIILPISKNQLTQEKTMNGIFNYHVPGVSSQKSNSDTGQSSSLRKDAADNFQTIMPWGGGGQNSDSLLKALYSLLAQLISQLGGDCDKPSCHGGDKPPISATTLAVGEEDGGTKPPDVTTKAMGEEDGGIKPPGGGDKPPIDMTTMALGEEDGGIKPPGGGNKPPIDVTTLALGEEDGGIKPPGGGDKPPIDVTTHALGEEDGGIKPPIDKPPIYTTMAVGEEDGGMTPFKK